jgi:hypothetical protein
MNMSNRIVACLRIASVISAIVLAGILITIALPAHHTQSPYGTALKTMAVSSAAAEYEGCTFTKCKVTTSGHGHNQQTTYSCIATALNIDCEATETGCTNTVCAP